MYFVVWTRYYFLSEGLRAFQATNNTLPDRIFFYRDGVSDGELEALRSVEIEKIKEAFGEVGPSYKYEYMPLFTFTLHCYVLINYLTS